MLNPNNKNKEMTDIIIFASGDSLRARQIAELFEGGNRVHVSGIATSEEDPVLECDAEWLVIESPEGDFSALKDRFGERVIILAPHRTAPEAAADIIASIKGASAASDPDVAWARTLGVKYDPERIAPHSGQQLPPPIPEEARPAAEPPRNPFAWHLGPARPAAPGRPHTDEPMPPTYLVWSVVMTVLCCLPAGIVAIVFSSMVSTKFYAGDIEGAKRASRRAEIWIIVSFVLGVLWGTLYIPLMLAGLGS